MIPDAIKARIGMVNFINTAPLYEVWKEMVDRPDWQVVEDTPARLNKMLFAGEIDLGLVSSHEYASHPHDYLLLPDLSISASGAVGSVFLFSKVPLEQLNDQQILLSPHSQTSNSLVKIILEEFYMVRPEYAVMHPDSGEGQGAATLAIGDRALRLQQGREYPVVLDLSESWQQFTGLPFVFAVWAVRKKFCEGEPECVAEIYRQICRCVQKGGEQLAEISARVAPRIPMSAEQCFSYLKKIEYDLSPQKQDALQLFFEYLISRGEVDPAAVPLQFTDN